MKRNRNPLSTTAVQLQTARRQRPFSLGIEAAALEAFRTLGLDEILDEAFPKGGGVPVSDHVAIMAIGRLRQAYSRRHTARWYQGSALQHLLGLPPEKVSDEALLETLERIAPPDDQIRVFEQVAQYLFEHEQFDFTISNYDTTSSYVEGEYADPIVDLVKHGYSREHRPEKKQIMIELFTAGQLGLPIYASAMPGNTVDNKRLPQILPDLKCILPEGSRLTLDRGLTALENRKRLTQAGLSYVCGVNMYSSIEKIAFANYLDGNGMQKYRSGDSRRFGIEITDHLKAIPQPGRSKVLATEQERIFLYFNPQLAEKQRATLDRNLSRVEDEVDQIKLNRGKMRSKKEVIRRITEIMSHNGNVKRFFEYEIVESNGALGLLFDRNYEKVFQTQMLKGFFALATNDEELNPGEMLKQYAHRAEVEQDFKVLKGPIQVRPIFLKNQDRILGHVFVCVLAQLLVKFMLYKLEQQGLYLTSTELMRELDQIFLIQDGDQFTMPLPDEAQMLLLNGLGLQFAS